MELLSRLLAGLYLATPVVAALIVAWRGRRGPHGKAALHFTLTCASGSVLGLGLVMVYAHVLDASPRLWQIILASYVCMGILFILKAVSWLLKEGSERLFRVRVPVARRDGWWVIRSTFALTLRTLLLFGLGLPYIMAVGMVYRPKVVSKDTPLKQLGFKFQPVRFTATDGMALDGWWIPAADRPNGQPLPADWATKTVIVCHGLGSNKANQLTLVRDLVPNGYNVLAFDFRAHGDSGGQVSSFGDLERRDVLGAVRWVQAQRPGQSKQIMGLGISMGGAALIQASADDSPEGRAIGKVAVYDTYDDLAGVAESAIRDRFNAPAAWMARHVALPIAAAHAGADLAGVAPVNVIDRVSPRPILIIHARGDKMIGFNCGVELFDHASQPKLRFWVGKADEFNNYFDRQGNRADHNSIIHNDDAATAVRLFFEAGESML